MMKFDELPQSAQKAYKTTSTVRKVTMFLGWGLGLVITIALCATFQEDYLSFIALGFMLGAWLHGIVHAEFLLKNVMNTLKKYSIIGLFIGLGICCMIIVLTGYASGIFLIVDTVLFILKKPLVYPFEVKGFLKSKTVQEELYQQNLDNSYVAVNIQKLNEMMKQGLITEEEFNSKKADLLERI